MPTETLVVLCTVPNEETGVTLARTLLEEHLVACVNIVPQVRSLYRYQGKVEDERELLLVMKTAADRYDVLEQRVRALHPYEVAEVLAIETTRGAAAYCDWVFQETRPA